MAIFGGGGGGAGAGGGIENPRFKGGKKKESKSLDWEKGFRAGHTVGYARCELEFGRESTQRTFERGKEEGYKEGYEKAKSESCGRCKAHQVDEKDKVKWQVKCRSVIIPGKFTHKIAEEISQALSYNSKLHYFVIEGAE